MSESIEEIAIIGMAGRFPGAKNIEEFWQNLSSGVESISYFTDDELTAAGINSSFINDKNYVKSGCILEDIELFDAAFFDINPKEAETTDPQQRLFLECAYTALENAGYDSTRCKERIGVYAGASHNNYLSFDLNKDSVGSVTCYQTSIGNDKDYLATRLSYKLNLTGPSLTVQTACSTSLVSITLACQSLLNYQCDMALAGGVSIHIPQKTGYLHEPGGTLSPDGHCYAFDTKAQGITIGNGLGVVVLKRLSEAVADGDYIHAVIKGAAINNDGAAKVGFTAPSVDGQAEAIAEAMILAEVEPDTISYIETHGTGTTLGDPIEIAALTKVFRAHTEQKGFCTIGSVKTNIGHLDAAAGVAGLIKTVLALQHQQIPPSLNFEQPNPKIDFANSPFYVNTKLTQWKPGFTPRRAGVSSLGMGGTNAHVILEEAPFLEQGAGSREQGRSYQLLVLSAKTETALETATTNLLNHLQQNPDLNLADVAYTLQVGRREFNYRRMLVCQNTKDAVNALNISVTRYQESGHRAIAFMFPGQGAQYVDMGKELYQTEAIFQEQVDLCCQLLQPHLGLDLRSLLYPQESELPAAAEKLKQTAIAQPALFVIEYALAKLWMSWGISPSAMIGHSIGEYVAACLAGVFSLEDALTLVARRGRLMQRLPAGAMLSVSRSAAEVQSLLNDNLSLAASNAPSSCVVSGTHDAIDALQERLTALDVECRRLHTSHAFHSGMMEPILEPFIKAVQQVKLNPPQIPFISNVTGTWITSQQATDPHYWAKHLRQTVQFSAGISTLLQEPNYILLEVGPRRNLGTLAKKHSHSAALCSLPHPREKQSDAAFLLNSLGKLWLYGVQIDWSGFYSGETRHRLPLPTYPFERQRYWIEQERTKSEPLAKKPDIDDWFYVPLWKQSLLPMPLEQPELPVKKSQTLIFTNELSFSSHLVEQLGEDAIAIKAGSKLAKLSDRQYRLNPGNSSDYDSLFRELHRQNNLPTKIVHLWSITSQNHSASASVELELAQEQGLFSLLFIVQALAKLNLTNEFQITVISNEMQSVTGTEILCPEKTTLLGAVKVIPQEYSNIRCRSIDIVLPGERSVQEQKLINLLVQELIIPNSDSVVAYRGNNRWLQTFEPIKLHESPAETSKFKEKGVYLITGGMGGIGLVIAEHLAKTVKAKLILTGRSVIPTKSEWEQWLSVHDESDRISRKIKKLQALEELGAEVLAISADVANLEQMQNVIAQGELLFGQINGVIHGAGITEGQLFSYIEQTNINDCYLQFAAKIRGVIVLEQILQNRQLDFCLLMSSLASILGGLGFVAYAAANIFMDNFVYQHNQINSVPWVSVNWDGWQISKEKESYISTNLASLAIQPEEGIKVFTNIVNYVKLNYATFSQIVVSTGALAARIQQWINFDNLDSKTDSQQAKSSLLYPRPNLQNSCIPPQNETEKLIAHIWQEVLSLQEIGCNDNFFELGGDSLLVVQVRGKLQAALNRKISTSELFEYPTITALAEHLNRQENQQPLFEQVEKRVQRQEAAIAEEMEQMKQRRRVHKYG
jgi:acyl transferase domain-containing protein